MDPQTSLIVFSVVFICAAIFAWAGGKYEAAKMQPQVDEANRLKLALELRRQKEEEAANTLQAELRDRINEQVARADRLERDLIAARRSTAEMENAVADAKHAGRETEHQLLLFQTRVTDLEGTLAAERGRLSALQAALEAKGELAQQLSNELASINHTLASERASSQQREASLREQLAEHEKNLAGGSTHTETLRAEIDQLRSAREALEQDLEARTADWNRRLAAAENKYQLLQKEYMSLVNAGPAGDAAATVVAAEEQARLQERARAAELRVQELEEQLAQSDAGTRKKLREAEYRVCELEFRLAEADEAKSAAVAAALKDMQAMNSAEEPRPEFLAKLRQDLKAAVDLYHNIREPGAPQEQPFHSQPFQPQPLDQLAPDPFGGPAA